MMNQINPCSIGSLRLTPKTQGDIDRAKIRDDLKAALDRDRLQGTHCVADAISTITKTTGFVYTPGHSVSATISQKQYRLLAEEIDRRQAEHEAMRAPTEPISEPPEGPGTDIASEAVAESVEAGEASAATPLADESEQEAPVPAGEAVPEEPEPEPDLEPITDALQEPSEPPQEDPTNPEGSSTPDDADELKPEPGHSVSGNAFKTWAEAQDKTLLSLVLRDYGGKTVKAVPPEMRRQFMADVESLTEPHPVDVAAVRLLAEQLRAIAGDLPGDFVFATIDLSEKITHYAVPNGPGAVEQIVELVEHIGIGVGINVYYAAAMFKTGTVTTYGGRTKENVVAVLGAVCDFDGKHDPSTRAARLPLAPGSEIESSPGNIHTHFWFDTPQEGAAIEPTLFALAGVTKADDCKTVEHLWRMPGTWNWPNVKKVTAGRSILPFAARWSITPETWNRVTADDLKNAVMAKGPEAFGGPAEGGKTKDASSSSTGPFDWNLRAKPGQPQKRAPEAELCKRLSAEGDRSALAFGVIAWLRQYRNYSAEEIFDALWSRSDLGVMGHYSDDGAHQEAGLRADIQRAFQKSRRDVPEDDTPQPVYRHAVIDPNAVNLVDEETPEPWERPVITLHAGQEAHILSAMDRALSKCGADIFQASGQLVSLGEMALTVRGGEEIRDIQQLRFTRGIALQEHFAAAAQFKRWDAHKGDYKVVTVPESLLAAYLARAGRWSVRTLAGFITAPTLRPDGSLLSKPGYDMDTGLFFDPRGTAFPPIPPEPSLDDVRKALKVFDDLIGTFPFDGPASRSVALAAFLTAVIRRTLPTAPLFGIDATAAGSGKGLLADTISIIGAGRKASAVSVGSSEEELEKRLGALFMQGEGFIVLDNVSAPIESDTLCMALTQESLAVRILGQSTMTKVSTNALIMATGNALRFHGDMGRRALRCLIDPKMERPDQRKFDFDPTVRAMNERGRYVAAALTVLMGYQAAGRPRQDGQQMGSFDQWAHIVRDALLWLGEADPVATVTEQMDDPRNEQRITFMDAWETSFGLGSEVTVSEVIEAMGNPETPGQGELVKAVLLVAAQQGGRGHGEKVDANRLGRWLQSNKLKMADRRRFSIGGITHKRTRWRLDRC